MKIPQFVPDTGYKPREMLTIKQFAKKHKISLRAARFRLDYLMQKGEMDRKKGPNNLFLYFELTHAKFRWHDPFNRCKRAVA